MIIAVVSAAAASSGFWAYIQRRHDKKDAKTELLVGLAHDIIISKGMVYIERGWITQEEYENLNDYIYQPYKKNGGNGSAERVMNEVNRLPIHKSSYMP